MTKERIKQLTFNPVGEKFIGKYDSREETIQNVIRFINHLPKDTEMIKLNGINGSAAIIWRNAKEELDFHMLVDLNNNIKIFTDTAYNNNDEDFMCVDISFDNEKLSINDVMEQLDGDNHHMLYSIILMAGVYSNNILGNK